MSVRKGNDVIAATPIIDANPASGSSNAVSSGGVYSALATKQATLVSGTNIKTINSGSILGSGNIDVLVNEATPASSLGVGYTTINTTYTDSINIGNGAQVGANNALALGAFASAEGQDSIAIYSSTGTSHRARTTHTGNIAIGYNALAINAAYTIAIGYNAYAQGANSIQLGTGNVALQNTFQVWTYPMLNKTTGIVPAARLADQTSATQGQVLTLDSNLDAVWANAGGGSLPSQTGNAGKFLTTDGTDASWSDKPLVNKATGTDSLTILGTGATNSHSINIGSGSSLSSATNQTVVGDSAKTIGSSSTYVTVLGAGAKVRNASRGIAIGAMSDVNAAGAIQIGTVSTGSSTTNSDANTFKVANANGNFEMMSADGTIPTDRYTTTPVADGVYVPKLSISSGVATRSWDTLSIPTITYDAENERLVIA